MAVAVATCSPTMNARYGDSAVDTFRSCAHEPPMIAGMSTAWPRLEIGKSSVMPWRSPIDPGFCVRQMRHASPSLPAHHRA